MKSASISFLEMTMKNITISHVASYFSLLTSRSSLLPGYLDVRGNSCIKRKIVSRLQAALPIFPAHPSVRARACGACARCVCMCVCAQPKTVNCNQAHLLSVLCTCQLIITSLRLSRTNAWVSSQASAIFSKWFFTLENTEQTCICGVFFSFFFLLSKSKKQHVDLHEFRFQIRDREMVQNVTRQYVVYNLHFSICPLLLQRI